MIFIEIWKFGFPELENQMEKQSDKFKKNSENALAEKSLHLYE